MIKAVAVCVAQTLHKRHFPVGVECGPEHITRGGYTNRIVLMRDRGGGDTTTMHAGGTREKPKRAVRVLQCVAEVYAQSGRQAATVNDHEELADKFVDALICALSEWATLNRALQVDVGSGRFLSADERNGEETWPGVAYTLPFGIYRGVYAVDFKGEGKSTRAIDRVDTHTTVKKPGAGDVAKGIADTFGPVFGEEFE